MKYLGREVKEEHVFDKRTDTFGNFYDAEKWIRENGYSSGSTDHGALVPVRKGEYGDFPQKWKNLTPLGKSRCCGVIRSNDYREGEVMVIIFK